jgi:hypothetical protein
MSHSNRVVKSFGYIYNTKIDMNNNSIINLAEDDSNNSAITNKKIIKFVNLFTIELSDIPIKICDSLFGSFIITVNGIEQNQPNASFLISKNNPLKDSYPNKFSCSKGEPNTYINIEWKRNDGIYILKTTSDYNGKYIIKII